LIDPPRVGAGAEVLGRPDDEVHGHLVSRTGGDGLEDVEAFGDSFGDDGEPGGECGSESFVGVQPGDRG
jgi:hypothetical protein